MKTAELLQKMKADYNGKRIRYHGICHKTIGYGYDFSHNNTTISIEPRNVFFTKKLKNGNFVRRLEYEIYVKDDRLPMGYRLFFELTYAEAVKLVYIMFNDNRAFLYNMNFNDPRIILSLQKFK